MKFFSSIRSLFSPSFLLLGDSAASLAQNTPGYATGLSGKPVLIPTLLISFLIALIVFIIIDLDRPKRGLIQVDQGIMLELRERINHDS